MGVLEQSGSQRAIENLLKVYYEPLELWYLRMSVEKVEVPSHLADCDLTSGFRLIGLILLSSPLDLTYPRSSTTPSTS